MDEIYEWLNPRIPVEYVLISFLVLSVAIVIGMPVMKGSRAKRFVLGALLAEYYFLVLCSTVICRASHGERHIELIPFWNYLDIWNRVDYPADLIEVLLNMALFLPIGLLLGGIGFKTKKVLFSVFSPQGRRGKPPSGAQNRFALRLADHQRSSPVFAGWDRLE